MFLLPIIVTLVSALVIFRSFVNYKKGTLSKKAAGAWIIVWVLIAAVFWSPEIASRLAQATGVGRGADLIIYIAIITIVYLLYRVFVRLERIDREITILTRINAHNDGEVKGSRSNSHSEL